MPRAKKNSGPMRVAVYGRVSSDEQASKEFSSVEVQEAVCRRWIEANGHTFAGFYSDAAKTGTSLTRPGFKRMLADGQDGCFNAIAVSYMSRLGRGRAYHNAEYELQKTQIKVLTVEEQFADDFNGQMNKDTKIFIEGVFPRMISQATKTMQKAMVERGYHVGGITPFGYVSAIANDAVGFRSQDKAPPKKLIPDPENGPLVARAYELFLETGGSYARVREYLDAVTSRVWTLNAVVNLLARETYTGCLTFGAWRNETAFEPVVDRQTWEAVQALTRTRTRAPKAAPVDKTPFPLRGLIRCSHCGRAMTPASHHGKTARVRYYECCSGGRRVNACPIKRVNADSVLEAVLAEVKRVAESPTRTVEVIREAVKLMPTADKMDGEQSALGRRLRETDKKLKNLMSVMEAGGAGVRSLITRLQELETERANIVEQQRQVQAKVAETRLERPDAEQVQEWFRNFLRLWDTATEEERSQLLPLIVGKVEMAEKERGSVRLLFAEQKPRFLRKSHSDSVVFNSRTRAGVGLEPTTFGL
jgi:site-specific DNA recombinase